MIKQEAQEWEREQSIFLEAVELPIDLQRTFVERLCGSDSKAVTRILELLEEDRQQQPLLDGDPDANLARAASFALHAEPASPLSYRQLGPYRLQRVLGEGGMGIVYLAERTDLGAVVAVKLLRDAWLSPMRRERFLFEQQTLVKLNHPAIARIYDAGTTADGTPWFAMEFVDGQPLTEYLRLRGASIQEDLQLFSRVCQAVRYAHTLAIVHRDLKPSNVFVTHGGEVKLLDFGIAKELSYEAEHGERTIAGLRFLSREYAAPEQFSGGEVGVFTDVYALGALLYQILTGDTPPSAEQRSNKPLEKPSSLVRKRRPSSAGQLSRQQWMDVDVLCTTALELEPERRYQSVDALLRDLQAHFEGRVLEARPATWLQVAAKFARRNRKALTAIAAGLLILATSALYFTVHLSRARDTAVAEAARTARIQKFMLNMLGNSDSEAGPSSDLKVVTLLDREAAEASTLGADPATEVDLYQTLGSMYDRLGKYEQAERMLDLGLQQAKRLGDSGEAEVAALTLQLAVLHGDRGELKNAQQGAELAVDMLSRSPSGPGSETWTEAQVALGRISLQSGDVQKAIAILTPIASKDPTQQATNPADVRDALSALALAELNAQRYGLAQAASEKTIALDRRLLGEHHAQTAFDLANLASIKAVQGDFSAAERLYREALTACAAWYGPDHPDVATVSSTLARILTLEGKDKEAEPFLQNALRIQQESYGPVHERLAFTLSTLGEIAFRKHDLTEAEADYSRALAINQSLFGDGSIQAAATRGNLGLVYLKQSRNTLAEVTLHKAVDGLARLPEGNNLIGTARARWGRCLLATRQYDAARTQLTLAEKALKAQHGAPAKELAHVHEDLAQLDSRKHAASN